MTALIRAILILPGTVAVVVPAVILWLTGTARNPFDGSTLGLGLLVLAGLAIGLGLKLAVVTVRAFRDLGRGTPAPWDPPKSFVVAGVYRHVRNPMITGMILILLGEAALFRSWPLLAWALFFFAANLVYIPLVEEPGLVRRFGAAYERYRRNVPRWIPRWSPWTDAGEAEEIGRGP